MNDFLLRSAGMEDLDDLVLLEKSVECALPNRDMFVTDEREFYEPVIRGRGHILLALDSRNHLAGASVIRFPDPDEEENLGHDLSLSSRQLSKVRHLESVFIRPDVQGKNLAERLIRENMRLTGQSGRTLSLATVWPGNAASLKLHLRLGLLIRAFAIKYGGRPRFILMSGCVPDVHAVPLFAESMDFDRHRELLKAGLAGTSVHPEPERNTFLVEYLPFRTSDD